MNTKFYSSIFTFVDMLLNLNLAFVVMFTMAFLMIAVPKKEGNVTLHTQMLITLTWDNKSSTDLDLWVKGPDGTIVGYPNKDGHYMNLDRDDLGTSNDTIVVNGQQEIIQQNVENVSVTDLIPGEYIVNVHYYRGDAAQENPVINVIKLSPYQTVYKGTLPIVNQQEETFVSFVVLSDGSITDIRTDIQIPFREMEK